MNALSTSLLATYRSGEKIEAIKAYRNAYGVTLVQAKDALELMAKGGAVPHMVPSPDMSAMTLRDYFAAQVIAGSYKTVATFEEVADQAYGIADAMLVERAKAHGA